MVRKIRNEVGGLAVALAAALAAMGSGTAVAVDLDQLVAQRMEVNDEAAKSQVRIDKISDDTDRLTAEYRVVLQRIDALRVYNQQVSELIASQEEEMASLRRQIDDVELVGREVTPLMLGMLDAIENFVELDVPFLPDERAERIGRPSRRDGSRRRHRRRAVPTHHRGLPDRKRIRANHRGLSGRIESRRVDSPGGLSTRRPRGILLSDARRKRNGRLGSKAIGRGWMRRIQRAESAWGFAWQINRRHRTC